MIVPYSNFSTIFKKKICYLRDLYCEAMLVPYSNFSTIFKKKNCYLRDLYCEAMKHTAWLLLLAALVNAQCGYRLSGRGRNLPAGARTIAIPMFKNETPQYQAENFVTAAIREEFITRSGLRLSESAAKADLVLAGRISAFTTMPIPNSDRGAVKRYEVRITIAVHLIDMKKNESFYEASGLVFREPYEAATGEFF
jgi:hypothetical protein